MCILRLLRNDSSGIQHLIIKTSFDGSRLTFKQCVCKILSSQVVNVLHIRRCLFEHPMFLSVFGTLMFSTVFFFFKIDSFSKFDLRNESISLWPHFFLVSFNRVRVKTRKLIG